jgi:hypothetical protein
MLLNINSGVNKVGLPNNLLLQDTFQVFDKSRYL